MNTGEQLSSTLHNIENGKYKQLFFKVQVKVYEKIEVTSKIGAVGFDLNLVKYVGNKYSDYTSLQLLCN